MVTAQTAELQAEQTQLNLQTRRQQAAVNLVRALGGGWDVNDLPSLSQSARISSTKGPPFTPAVSGR